MNPNVQLIHSTPEAERHMGYCARVSNPANQDNPDSSKLLGYCIKNGHWSVFEMATLCVEITTSRGISAQILRHRSFSFQEFSQRYASPTDFVKYEARRQDQKNRQNSHDDLPEADKQWFLATQQAHWDDAKRAYDVAIERGIAKECARFLLPMNVETRLYMIGSARSWIHYIQLRTTPGTQKEHRDIALGCKDIFSQQFPETAKALEWMGSKETA
jgi:thymidylate synthase (FAD)